ncbi:MAG: TonB-dependent receptor [Alphaproteobacteria bacterium]|nr:TonB-dependent receptor [Alphaproteobacteria bacterium]
MRHRLLVATALSAFGIGFAAPVLAQDATSDEIVVTAQRRAENIQDVPASVTALSAAQLEERQVADVLDLQYQTPNISIATGTGTANSARIFLRGVGEDESRGAVDPAVGVYVDGIYIGRQVGSLLDLVDIERIEVLRGPQGTLYGRNTNGGAIKLISVRPQNEASLDLGATVGSDGRLDFRGTGNYAFTPDTAVRVTALHRERDGFWRLTPNGAFAAQARDVGAVETDAFRISLSHQFNPDWDILVAYDYTDDNSDPTPDSAAPTNDADGDVFTIEPLPGVTCSAATPAAFLPIGCFTAYGSQIESQGASVNITGEIGNFTFASLSGYRQMEDELASRIGFPYLQQTDQDQFSQEFTITSNFAGPFNFVAGVYYFTEDVQLDTVFVSPFSLTFDTESTAVFVQGAFDVTAQGTLTAGVRYTDETKDFFGANLSNAALTRTASQDFENTSFTLKYDHQFTDNLMVYGAYSTGFKSGGWSPDCFSATACFLPVAEETLDSFEIGFRGDLFDRRLRLNGTYFFNSYENLQIGATVPGLGFTRFNVDETEIQGVEVEFDLAVTDNFSITGNLGVLDGEYTSVTLAQAGGLTNSGASCPGGVVTVECALGLELKNAPEYKGVVGFVYRTPLHGGELSLRGDVQFEDDSWSLVANGPPHALTDPGAVINARVGWESPGGRWRVALWGQNLTDEEYWRASTAQSFSVYAAPPLTWGVDLGVRF